MEEGYPIAVSFAFLVPNRGFPPNSQLSFSCLFATLFLKILFKKRPPTTSTKNSTSYSPYNRTVHIHSRALLCAHPYPITKSDPFWQKLIQFDHQFKGEFLKKKIVIEKKGESLWTGRPRGYATKMKEIRKLSQLSRFTLLFMSCLIKHLLEVWITSSSWRYEDKLW